MGTHQPSHPLSPLQIYSPRKSNESGYHFPQDRLGAAALSRSQGTDPFSHTASQSGKTIKWGVLNTR